MASHRTTITDGFDRIAGRLIVTLCALLCVLLIVDVVARYVELAR